MFKQKLINSFIISIIFFLFSSCDTADDNNPFPTLDVRDKYTGEWKVTASCSKGNYTVNITKDSSNSVRVLLQGFANSTASQPDTALVTTNSVYLYQQMNSEGWLIEGAGNYQVDGSIAWVFTLVISGTQESCTATYVKD